MNTPPDECVYCGSTENLTAEHAPPKLIFPKPRPSDLITVRACKACNAAGSKDAEYFRVFLCMNPIVTKLPTVRALKPVVEGSFGREEAAGLLQLYEDSVEPFCEGKTAFLPDMNRVHEVIRRIGRCLYLYETGERLPPTHGVKAVSMEMMSQHSLAYNQRIKEAILQPLSEQPLRVVAGGMFAYSFLHEEATGASVCGMVFYGVLPFAAVFANERRLRKRKQAR